MPHPAMRPPSRISRCFLVAPAIWALGGACSGGTANQADGGGGGGPILSGDDAAALSDGVPGTAGATGTADAAPTGGVAGTLGSDGNGGAGVNPPAACHLPCPAHQACVVQGGTPTCSCVSGYQMAGGVFVGDGPGGPGIPEPAAGGLDASNRSDSGQCGDRRSRPRTAGLLPPGPMLGCERRATVDHDAHRRGV